MFMALHKWAPGCARTASQEHHTVSCLIHEHHRCEELNNKVFSVGLQFRFLLGMSIFSLTPPKKLTKKTCVFQPAIYPYLGVKMSVDHHTHKHAHA